MPKKPEVYFDESKKEKRQVGPVRKIILLLAVLIIIISSVAIVGAGERGVLLTFGKVEDVIFDEGFHFKIPFVQSVRNIDVKTLRFTASSEDAASNDLQQVTTEVTLNYKIDSNKVNSVFQKIGDIDQVEDKIIFPAIKESVKAATANFNAEELITRRSEVKNAILNVLIARLSPRDIIAEDLSITDFKFSPQFAAAIESKQVAEQNALKAKRDLDRIKIEAEQIRTKAEADADAKLSVAKAEAEALRIQSEAIKGTPDLINLRAIEKWDGVLPKITGAAVPFINIDSMLNDSK